MRRLAIGAVVCVAAVAGCSREPVDTGRPKLVIIGFDGLDPDLVQQYMKDGHLPAFSRLMAGGGAYPLETTVSPESPTAWASFATGVNPGKHNIYDFLVRDTKTYLPDLGMVRREPPRFLLDWVPIRRPRVVSLRGGTSFWVTAGGAGVRSSILTVPITFPPEDVPNGELLSGLPLPDLRGTMGTFYYFATDLSRYEEGNTEFGGILRRLIFDGQTARAQLVGPPNPIVRTKIQAIRRKGPLTDADRTAVAELEAKEDVTLPMSVTWARGSKSAAITLGGQTVTLTPGTWSKWIDLTFPVNLFVRLHGMVQLYLIAADQELQLYISPINFKPDAPPVAISAPPAFAADLYERLGPFRTLGWSEATWPLNEGRMDEATFMDDLYKAFDDRAQVILDRLTHRNWDLLVGVIESTDRVQHMMYRLIDPSHPMYDAALAAKYGDAIRAVYRRADQFVAEVMEPRRAGHDRSWSSPIMASTRGASRSTSTRGWSSRATWRSAARRRARRSSTTCSAAASSGRTSTGAGRAPTRWDSARSTSTCAAAKSRGIVSPGAEYTALASELVAKLKSSLIDPDTGQPIVRAVYKRDDVYSGEYLGEAADLQVGFDDGYRVSWQTTLGGSPQGIVYPNMKKWSGDHGGFDFMTTAGVLITNRPDQHPDASNHRHRPHGPDLLRHPSSGHSGRQAAVSLNDCPISIVNCPMYLPIAEYPNSRFPLEWDP